MVASSTKRLRPLAVAGLRLTARDVAVLLSVWELRQATRAQLQRLHFGGAVGTPGARAASVALRRLGLLHAHGYLVGRRLPVDGHTGRPALVYALGKAAVPLLAERLGRDRAAVARRQRLDVGLGALFAGHRQAVNDVRIALLLACRAHGYRLAWRSDEELAALRESVTVGGERLPIRPDGYAVLELGPTGPRTACFIEVQRASDPATFQRKARAYLAYWASGAYTTTFGTRSLRVLGVTDTPTRARHLAAAAERAGGGTLFWTTDFPALTADPFGAIWHVGRRAGRHRLLEPPARVP